MGRVAPPLLLNRHSGLPRLWGALAPGSPRDRPKVDPPLPPRPRRAYRGARPCARSWPPILEEPRPTTRDRRRRPRRVGRRGEDSLRTAPPAWANRSARPTPNETHDPRSDGLGPMRWATPAPRALVPSHQEVTRSACPQSEWALFHLRAAALTIGCPDACPRGSRSEGCSARAPCRTRSASRSSDGPAGLLPCRVHRSAPSPR